MKRRDILKGLGVLPFGLIIPKTIKSKEKPKLRINDDIYAYGIYRGFKYFWTGWKSNGDSAKLYGQWLAVNPSEENHPRIFSGSNGTGGQYLKGACFDLTTVSPHQIIEVSTNEKTKDLHKKAALLNLFAYIDTYWIEKTKPKDIKELYGFGFTGFISAK